MGIMLPVVPFTTSPLTMEIERSSKLWVVTLYLHAWWSAENTSLYSGRVTDVSSISVWHGYKWPWLFKKLSLEIFRRLADRIPEQYTSFLSVYHQRALREFCRGTKGPKQSSVEDLAAWRIGSLGRNSTEMHCQYTLNLKNRKWKRPLTK
jgi:hypothetical protein